MSFLLLLGVRSRWWSGRAISSPSPPTSISGTGGNAGPTPTLEWSSEEALALWILTAADVKASIRREFTSQPMPPEFRHLLEESISTSEVPYLTASEPCLVLTSAVLVSV